jgi:ribosomal protein L7/L12
MEQMTREQRRERIVQLERELAELRQQELAEKDADQQAIIEQCRVLKRSNKEMQAIKLYRDKMGVSLREAKDYVDSM